MLTVRRQATILDADAIAEVQVISWKRAYAGIVPQPYLDGMRVQHQQSEWKRVISNLAAHVMIAVHEESVCGFIAFGQARDAELRPYAGEIYALYVEPVSWRSSVGKSLFEDACGLLREEDYTELALWVLRTNVRATSFYEAQGMARDGAEKSLEFSGTPLIEQRFKRSLI